MIALVLLLQTQQAATPACIWNQSTMPGRGVLSIPTAARRSPQDSVTALVGTTTVKVCYSRPSVRGRTMIGGTDVPYGQVWRTGANEATMIHITGHIMVAGMHVDAGTYSLYTVPGEREWEVILNRAYMQWGHESTYTDSIRAQELGRGRVPVTRLREPVEQFTIRSEPASGGNVNLILEWENSRVSIPIRRM